MAEFNVKYDWCFLMMLGFAIETYKKLCDNHRNDPVWHGKEFLSEFVLSALLVKASDYDVDDLSGWAEVHLSTVLEGLVGLDPNPTR